VTILCSVAFLSLVDRIDKNSAPIIADKRVKHLYQGRYKAILVDNDSYLLELSRYLHLNPVRFKSSRERSYQEQIKTLERYTWSWSSLSGYIDTKNEVPWITYNEILNQVGGSRTRYREFVREGIKTGYRIPWDQVEGQMVLGDKIFLQKLKGKWEKAASRREQPPVRAFSAVDSEVVIRLHIAIGKGGDMKAPALHV
jgi:putative transposase